MIAIENEPLFGLLKAEMRYPINRINDITDIICKINFIGLLVIKCYCYCFSCKYIPAMN